MKINKEQYENFTKKFNQIFLGFIYLLGLGFDIYYIYLSGRLIFEEVLSNTYAGIPILLILFIVPSTIDKIKKLIKMFKRKDDNNETTWYITISTNNYIISTYNNWFIPKLYGLFTIPVSTDKTDYIIRKEKKYVRIIYC